VAIGYVYARAQRPDMTRFNRIVLDVLSPLLVYTALAGKEFQLRDHLPLLAGGALLILATGAVAWGWSRGRHTQRRTLVPVVMFTNCGNMGLPLRLLAFGRRASAPRWRCSPSATCSTSRSARASPARMRARANCCSAR
jgi:predicted permease